MSWIKLNRSLTDHKIWHLEPFTRGQAWVDLIALANYKQTIIFKRGVEVIIERGDIGWSEDSLADRWKWSRGKVRRFVKYLIDNGMLQKIVQKKTSVSVSLRIVNYNEYQSSDTESSTEDGTEDGRKTVQEQERKERKEIKNIEERKKIFAHSLNPFLETYGKEMLNEFYAYWTEHGPNDKKMRFEKEKSFGLSRRLATWQKKQIQYNEKTNNRGFESDKTKIAIEQVQRNLDI
jgi:hypothetical protein